MKDRFIHDEEDFHARDQKHFKKERRHAQETDRSKFKKSDLDQAKKEIVVLSDDPNLRTGRVIGITGEGVWVEVEQVRLLCSLKGLMKKEKMLSKNLIAVGDLVRVELIDADEGAIVSVEPRYSSLSRLDVSGKKEQLIAVNVDQVLIVSSLVLPPLKPALIDRYLIAAERGNIHPIIIVNKIDHLDESSLEEKTLYKEFLAAYEQLGYPILSISTKTGVGLDNLRAIMKNKASVFAGQSGVGKSSLLNAALGLNLKIGELTQKTFKGCHTTTSAKFLPLPDGGFCIDTPGIRSFGVWQLDRDQIMHHFREFHLLAGQCRYPDCVHLNEPACAVKEGLKLNKISAIRYESYKSLMDEIIAGIDNRTKRKLNL
jgi:ribosome biogenesis GTPase